MGLVADHPTRAPTPTLTNGESTLREKLYTPDIDGETTQFSFFSAQKDVITRADSIQLLKSSSTAFETLMETGMHTGLWWLHVSTPSNEDIDALSRVLDIHPLTVEDIKIRELREKTELFGPYYFVSLRLPQWPKMAIGSRASSANIYGIVFREGIITFTYGINQHAAHVWSRIKKQQSQLSLTSDWICYALIDDIVDDFAPLINRVQTGVEMVEDGVSITRPGDIGLALQSIYKCRKEVTHIRQLLHDKTDVVRSFARHCGSLGSTPAEVTLYLSDIQDHVLTMMANLANAEQMLSRSQSKYLSQLSFDSTRMRNTIVGTLARLTGISAVIVMMQVITGLFSMNISIPGLGVAGLSCWFGILGLILGLILLFLVVARRIMRRQ
jgi:magnesium transporter